MKKNLLILVLFFFAKNTYSRHIVGGELFYTYIGVGTQSNASKYKVTLRLFTECNQLCGGTTGVACPPNLVFVNIFINSISHPYVRNILLNKIEQPQISLTNIPSCVTNPPSVCYQVNTYSTTVELVDNNQGYVLSFNDCCRTSVFNANNMPSNNIGLNGSTYTAILPGKNQLPVGNNSTAIVELNDAALICYKSKFELSFNAVDPDGDSLVYSFINAYDGEFNGGITYPPYKSIEYNSPIFTGAMPLSDRATIDRKTGLISGYAPYVTGKAIVNVIIIEYRNGINIAEHRKDFIVKVDACERPTAYLAPKLTNCDNFEVDFKNDGSDVNVITWLWDFGDVASGANNISTSANPTHTFSAAGDFTVKLYLNKGLSCEDSTELVVKVYPGFKPDYTYEGICVNQPVQFKDLSVHDYGTLNKWVWNFGDPSSGINNVAYVKDPTHTYSEPGIYYTQLGLQSDKGCVAFIYDSIEIKSGPLLSVAPKDTLICTVDTLQISASGIGTGLQWQPNYMISNANSLTPLVSPDITTTYTVNLTNEIGCTTSKNILINVVDSVTQEKNYDTIICAADPILLRLNSNALYYIWTPNDGSLNNATIKNPIAKPLNSTNYIVLGKISDKCFAQNTIKVIAIPYPKPLVSDVNVCLGNSAQLKASGGSIYNWSPRAFLSSTIIPNPSVINPTTNVLYTLTVRDTLGCPKPIQTIVRLNVIKIKATINTKDTSVVINQPLQLYAGGSTNYIWLPDNRWLSSISVSNPIALPKNDITYTVKVIDSNGCFDITSTKVKVYNVLPDLYLPNAFSPNGDNKNDFFKPLALGIKSLDLFQVYNRWGQLLYNSSSLVRGWDGNLAGQAQESTTYIWLAEATDYTGKKIKKRGNVILIR